MSSLCHWIVVSRETHSHLFWHPQSLLLTLHLEKDSVFPRWILPARSYERSLLSTGPLFNCGRQLKWPDPLTELGRHQHSQLDHLGAFHKNAWFLGEMRVWVSRSCTLSKKRCCTNMHTHTRTHPYTQHDCIFSQMFTDQHRHTQIWAKHIDCLGPETCLGTNLCCFIFILQELHHNIPISLPLCGTTISLRNRSMAAV